MKTPSSDLFQLIKSLEMSESRYLSLSGKEKKEDDAADNAAFRQMIQLLQEAEAYKEQEVKLQLGIADDNYFKRLKHYAHEQVLRSLENFHAASSPEIIILRKFIQAEILFKKKQFASLRRCIEQAWNLCIEYDKLSLIPLCLDWKLRSGIVEPQQKRAGKVQEKELDQWLKQFSTLLKIRRFNLISWRVITADRHPDSKDIENVKKWIGEVKALIPKSEHGFPVLREYGQTLSTLYRLLGDWKSSLKYRELVMHRIEAEPKKMQLRAYEYLTAVNNVFIAYQHLGKKNPDKVVGRAIRFYEKIPQSLLSVRLSDGFINLINNYVAFLLKQKKMELAWEKCQQVYNLVGKQSFRFSNNLAEFLFTNLCVLAIFRKEYRAALRYHNQLESLYKLPLPGTLLLGLVVYYELGESDLMYYKTRSLRQRLRFYPDEKEFLRLFTDVFSSGITADSAKTETVPALTTLLDNIRTLRGVEEKLRDFEGFDYIEWIHSKIKPGRQA